MGNDDDDVDESRSRRRGISLFRGEGALGLFDSGTMTFPEFDPGDQAEMVDDPPMPPNLLEGQHDVVLFRGEEEDGFSLVRAWFAPHYVLPRHTHDADCLYYVAEGSLTMGSQELTVGDGFFVPSGAPYGYEAGPDGVVVMEFRTRTSFGMKIVGGQVERLRRLNAAAEEHGERWKELRAEVTG